MPSPSPQAAGAERIPCPRCRANNFVGQAQCWQCRAPLPPPDALHSRPSAPFAPPARAQTGSGPAGAGPQYHGRRPPVPPAAAPFAPEARPGGRPLPHPALVLGMVGVGVLTFLLVWLFAGHPRPEPPAPRPTPEVAVSPPVAPTSTPPPPAIADPADSDPVLSEGKRAVERESRRLDLTPPPTSADGRVHLRSGGTISPEEWREAQRKVKDSSVFKDPPNPPPF